MGGGFVGGGALGAVGAPPAAAVEGGWRAVELGAAFAKAGGGAGAVGAGGGGVGA